MNKKIAVVGWAQSKHERENKTTHLGELLYNTVKDALKNTHISIEEIDTVINASCDVLDGRSISNVFIIEAIGAFLKEESKVEEDGAYALLYAYSRLLAGPFKTAMVVAHSKGSESSPQYYTGLMTDPFYLRPLGLEGMTSYALQAQAYCHKYKITEEHAANVVVKNRKNGAKNDYAVLQKEVTKDDVLKSPYLSTPIKTLDASPVSDGCCVCILAAEDVAGKYTDTPVFIDGVGLCNDVYYPGYRDLASTEIIKMAAEKAYAQAGIKNPQEEIDFAEVYEPFSFHELMIAEGLKLCGDGEGGKFVESGAASVSGKIPVNASGGALCANPLMATGLVRMVEAAAQLSGKAGKCQIPKKVKKGVVHATSGLFLQSNIVYVLSH